MQVAVADMAERQQAAIRARARRSAPCRARSARGSGPPGPRCRCGRSGPPWRMAGLSSSRIRHSMVRCASLAASVASSTSPASNASASHASAAAASPSGRDQASSTSTYQGAAVSSGLRTPCRCVAAASTQPRGHQLEAGDQLGEAVLAVGQQRDGRLGRRHGREQGHPLPWPGEQPQGRGGDDPEAALRPQEGLLQVVAGIVLAQRAQAVPDPAVAQHHLEARAPARAPCRSG